MKAVKQTTPGETPKSVISTHEMDPTKDQGKNTPLADLFGPKYPVDNDDIGFIIRTGFEVQVRLMVALETWLDSQSVNQDHVVMFSDRETKLKGRHIQDAIKLVPKWVSHIKTNPRFEYYRKVSKMPKGAAIDPNTFVRGEAWQFDAIKQVATFALGVQQLLKRGKYKWIALVDDDTYVHVPSLQAVLSRFDSNKPLVLGNIFTDKEISYMHGGSGIYVSANAIQRLFVDAPELVEEMLDTGAHTTLGDQHISIYLKKAGALLERTSVHAFHEYWIETEYVQGAWYCQYSASWHQYGPDGVRFLHQTLQTIGVNRPIRFYEIVEAHPFYADSSLWKREGRSYTACYAKGHYEQPCEVFKRGENGTQELDAPSCEKMCIEDREDSCAAWSFDGLACQLSKGFSLHGWQVRGTVSGVNKALIGLWRAECQGKSK
ncbi:hypothetical protein BCR37DRAFT_384958 [Protomyces lactucae-debilis]|uniref:N-acetylgalactosaminide beta-1,3-galactosyltransferase n=1 Tax=Protomyces lactucae-debilis TaxID=2754530 RepID=A0A1Y2FWT3_PROLT|nr:uncharacterized protein BCR37DRAFT_384958 [Protomyces lactucae-debilis]ORY87646.1 hypothetical protein BCR37DRAFT_384958 [Protomyces lactucae-debilis]